MIESAPAKDGRTARRATHVAGASGFLPALSGERLLLATLRAMGDGVLSCDCTGAIVLMNAVAEQLTGWPEQEALGMHVADVLPLMDETTREAMPSPVAALLAGEFPQQPARHTCAIRRDGTEYAIESTAAPVYGDNEGDRSNDEDGGTLQGAVLVFRDVSRARRAEWILELLAEAGRELTEAPGQSVILDKIGRMATRQFTDLVLFDLLNQDGSVSRLAAPSRNPAQDALVAELLKFPLSSLFPRTIFEGAAPAASLFVPELDQAWIEHFTMGDTKRLDLYHRLALHSMICVPLVAGGQHFGLLTFGRTRLRASFDKEDRIAAEDLGRRVGAALQRTRLLPVLQAERGRLRAIIENMPIGIIVADRVGKIVMGNNAVEKIMRHPTLPSESMDEHGDWVSYHADGRRVQGHEYPLARAILSGDVIPPEEYLYHRGDGSKGWISLTAAPLMDDAGTVTGGVVAILDIDAQKQAQEALRASEERSQQILTSTRDCIKVLDLEGNLLSMNEEGQQRLGINDFKTVQGACWFNFWPADTSAAKAAVQAALQGGVGSFEGEFTTSKGEVTWWDITLTPMLDSRGKVVQLLAVSRESTTRKQAEFALRESETRFRRLVEQSSIGVMIGNPDGALSYMNSTLLLLLGYSEADVAEGKLCWDDLAPGESFFWDQTALMQLRQDGVCPPYEKALRAKSGMLVPTLLGASVLREHAQGLEIAVFLTDLTAQKKTEQALLESEKLAAVGKLASSISHEINNPLEAITNLLFIMGHAESLPDEVRGYLSMADKEVQRVSQIVAQTLRFHRQSTRPRKINPAELLDQVLALYAARFANYDITPVCDYHPEAVLTCYEGDVRQVINNLVSNAVDAMRVGGVLTIRTCLATQWKTGRPGVRITVADTGAGMTPAVRKRIFEAFFTTKDIHGTGLGLWISSQIVTKHGGTLDVRSTTAVGRRGSVFALWLPLDPVPALRDPSAL